MRLLALAAGAALVAFMLSGALAAWFVTISEIIAEFSPHV